MALADKVAAIFEGPGRAHPFPARSAGNLAAAPARRRQGNQEGRHQGRGREGRQASERRLPPAQRYSDRPRRQAGLGGQPAGVLHEGIHALVDMYKCKEVTVLNDEAAAYSPKRFICARRTAGSTAAPPRWRSTMPPTSSPRRTISTASAASGFLDDVADLRAAIHEHPAYSGIGAKQKTSGHGLHAH